MKGFAFYIIAAALCLAQPLPARAEVLPREETALKKSSYTLGPVQVREKYISMTGPVLTDKVSLGTDTPVWVKGFRVDVVDAKGEKESSEYLCHSWLTLGKPEAGDQKMLTSSEGLEDMSFPPGFAVRVEAKPDNAALLAQVLNNNEKTDKNLAYKLTVNYIDDATARQFGVRPLRTVSVAIMAKDANPEGGSEICRTQDEIGEPMPAAPGAAKSVVHFDVPPGRHEYRSVVPKESPLYLGGTIHYIKLHLHPYGESVALLDKTTGKEVWSGRVRTGAGRAILTDIDFYSSVEGIKIDTTHDYEVVSVYNNTTDKLTDAMAVLRVYVSDDSAPRAEEKPTAAPSAK